MEYFNATVLVLSSLSVIAFFTDSTLIFLAGNICLKVDARLAEIQRVSFSIICSCFYPLADLSININHDYIFTLKSLCNNFAGGKTSKLKKAILELCFCPRPLVVSPLKFVPFFSCVWLALGQVGKVLHRYAILVNNNFQGIGFLEKNKKIELSELEILAKLCKVKFIMYINMKTFTTHIITILK